MQWEPENYGTERQHYSVFDVVTKQQILISNLLNQLLSFQLNGSVWVSAWSIQENWPKNR